MLRRQAGDRLRIVVSGMVAGVPYQGGATWAVLQYVLGLRALGHHVVLIEPIAPADVRPSNAPLAASTNACYFRDVVTRFALEGCAALLRQDTRETVGMPYGELRAASQTADLLINVSGMLTDPQLIAGISRRVYLDLDPAFNQLWHAAEGIDMRLDGHTQFVTVGCSIGKPACAIPTCGRTWIATLQPIVLSEWPLTGGRRSAAWTTVGNWRGYGSIQYDGVFFGQKAHSMRRFISIPRRTREQFVLALAIDPGEARDLAALAANGWRLVDPGDVSATPDEYRTFIQRSKAEIGIAKSGYVEARCGWFSDRSACYLASGRPVLAQDTGLDGILPTGEGLVTFTTEDELIAGVEEISGRYERHAIAAREIAEACFDSNGVLTRVLEEVCR